MLENLKPFYTSILKPVTRLFMRIGLHPNHVTIFGFLLFVVAGYFSARASWYYALAAVIAGSLMDGIDGLLARESRKTSRFGAILDSSFDRLTEMVLLGGLLVFYAHSDRFSFIGIVLCFSTVCVSVMISYVKARCESVGIDCSRGLMQRPERLILFSFGLLSGQVIILWVLGFIVFLGTITVIQRLHQAAAGSKKRNRQSNLKGKQVIIV